MKLVYHHCSPPVQACNTFSHIEGVLYCFASWTNGFTYVHILAVCICASRCMVCTTISCGYQKIVWQFQRWFADWILRWICNFHRLFAQHVQLFGRSVFERRLWPWQQTCIYSCNFCSGLSMQERTLVAALWPAKLTNFNVRIQLNYCS